MTKLMFTAALMMGFAASATATDTLSGACQALQARLDNGDLGNCSTVVTSETATTHRSQFSCSDTEGNSYLITVDVSNNSGRTYCGMSDLPN